MQRCRSPRTSSSFDEQPGHDGLASAGIVGQQEPERLAGKHLLVDRRDLVRERFDQRGVDGQQRIEEVGQPDAVGFGNQAEHPPVAVEAPRTARRRRFPGSASRSR